MADDERRDEERVASPSEEKVERPRDRRILKMRDKRNENLDLPDPPPDPWTEQNQDRSIEEKEEDEEDGEDEEEEEDEEEDVIAYLTSSDVPSRNSATSTMAVASLRSDETFEQLDRLYDLAEQILELRTRSSRLFKRVRELERLKALRKADKRAERAILRSVDLKNDFPEEDTGFAESLLDAMLSNGRDPLLQRRNVRSPSSRRSSRTSPFLQTAFDDAAAPKVSKWTRVKAAFKWERACTNDVVGMESLATDTATKFLKIPDTGGSSWSGSNLSSELSAPTSPVARPSSISSSNEDVFDEPRKSTSSPEQQQRQQQSIRKKEEKKKCDEDRRSRSLDSESLVNQMSEGRPSITITSETNSLETLKSPKVFSGNSGEKNVDLRKPAPNLTIAIPSNEEDLRSVSSPESISPLPSSALNSGENSPQRANARRNALGTRDFKRQRSSMPEPISPGPKMQRQDSRWNKVRRAFLSNTAFSVPPSPVRVFAGPSFFQDFSTPSAQDNLRLSEDRLGADFKKKLREWKRAKKGHRRLTDWQLWSPRSPSRLGNTGGTGLRLNVRLGAIDESEFIALEKLLDPYDEKESRDFVPTPEDMKCFDGSKGGSEVLIRTSVGSYRFEGISREFTRKLYDWEKYRGISPRSSTFRLLAPGYAPFEGAVDDSLPITPARGTGNEKMFPGVPRRSKSTGNITEEKHQEKNCTRRSRSLRSLNRLINKFDVLETPKNVANDSQKAEAVIDDSEPEAMIVEIEDVIEETASPLERVQPHQTPVYSVAASETTSIAIPLGTVTSSHEPSPVIFVEVADTVDREARGTSSRKRIDSEEVEEHDKDDECETSSKDSYKRSGDSSENQSSPDFWRSSEVWRERSPRTDPWDSARNSKERSFSDKDEDDSVGLGRSEIMIEKNQEVDYQGIHDDDSVASYCSIRSIDSHQDKESNGEDISPAVSVKKGIFDNDVIERFSSKKDSTDNISFLEKNVSTNRSNEYEEFSSKISNFMDLPCERETVRGWNTWRCVDGKKLGINVLEDEARSNLSPLLYQSPMQPFINDCRERAISSEVSTNSISTEKKFAHSLRNSISSKFHENHSSTSAENRADEKIDLRRYSRNTSSSSEEFRESTRIDLTNREGRCVERIVINEKTLNRIVVPTATTEKTVPFHDEGTSSNPTKCIDLVRPNSIDERETNESSSAPNVFVKTKRMIFSPFRRTEDQKFHAISRKNSDEESTRSLPRRKSKSKSRSASPKNSRQDALLLRMPLSLPWPLRTSNSSTTKDRDIKHEKKTGEESNNITRRETTESNPIQEQISNPESPGSTRSDQKEFDVHVDVKNEGIHSKVQSTTETPISEFLQNSPETEARGSLFKSNEKDSNVTEEHIQSDGPFETIYFYRGRIEDNAESSRCESLPSDLAHKLRILSNAAARRDGRIDTSSELPESRASRLRRAKESFLSRRGGPFCPSTIDSRFIDRKRNSLNHLDNFLDQPSGKIQNTNENEEKAEEALLKNEVRLDKSEETVLTKSKNEEYFETENGKEERKQLFTETNELILPVSKIKANDRNGEESSEIVSSFNEESASSRSDLVKSASAGMIRIEPNTSRGFLETNRGCESLPRMISKRRESGPLRKIVGKLRLSRLIRGGHCEEGTMSTISTLCRQSLFVDVRSNTEEHRENEDEDEECTSESETRNKR